METRQAELLSEPQIAASFEPFTLEAIYDDKIFETTSVRAPHWLRDNRRFSYLDKAPDSEVTTLWICDATTGEKRLLIPPERLKLPTTAQSNGEEKTLTIPGYQWSPDESRILFARLPQKRASQGDNTLYIYTLKTQELTRITTVEAEHRNAKWSPDGQCIGYVRDNDLFLRSLTDGSETRLTFTGSLTLYNGRFGWVYEEELSLVDGWSWSPYGTHIAFFEQDEAQVPVVPITNFDDDHTLPEMTRYPKAGDPNPTVRVGVLPVPKNHGGHGEKNRTTENTERHGEEPRTKNQDPIPEYRNTRTPEDLKTAIENPKPVWLDIGQESEIYISWVQWTPQGELLVQRMPRAQDRVELLVADPETGQTQSVHVEEDAAWVDRHGAVTFIGESDRFLWQSERDGYNHLYLYDLTGNLVRQVTQGVWDVTSIEGVNVERGEVYFTAALPNPLERQVFAASLEGGEIRRLTAEPGTHHPVFSADGAYFLGEHSSHCEPPRTRVYQADGQEVAVVQENAMPKLQNRRVCRWEFLTCETSDGATLHLAMLKPPDFDRNARYPVLMYTYGGPGSQVVRDYYGIGRGWEQLLAQEGVISVLVDPRGTGARGRAFKKCTARNLGYWEVHDMIEAAKWLGALPYVDAGRIGIWGWSYGGYVASLAILRGAEVFKAAVAVAPVTHWKFYDSIYTERFMRRPQENSERYEDSAPLTHTGNLKGDFLLVHGLADDNVHFQNTARLAAVFQKQNKPFHTMFYPGKRHGLEGVSLHVFGTITEFVRKYL